MTPLDAIEPARPVGPTDRRALRETLRAAGVADTYYRIEGVHEPAPTPPDFLYLRSDPDGSAGIWETGVYERGVHQAIARHAHESDACAHLLRLLS
ncbi:hypothetical protein [Streptomyces clavuligerus]|uniref:hypothetical protein n=1 Tax=Streptomyces clavuligerus TaxID=1901 RepID=UPI00020D91F0|nr:hypothetical protein [Streptomyces clavuligerus]WDN55020.1 hypothetical protein LL058_26015 [Streptomyces clavuligerus]